MLGKSVKSILERSSRELRRNLIRSISKTSGASNSEAIVTDRQKNEGSQNVPNRWMRLNRFSNNRALSIQAKVIPPVANVSLVSKEESRDFMAVFPDLVRDLTDVGRHTDIPEVMKSFVKILQYNVPNGKKNRGLAVVAAYKMLEDADKLTPENMRLANVLGWCVEMLQGFFLVLDDVMDNSETRRGLPCWYKHPGVGLNAINHGIMIENGVYSILRRHFSGLPCYVPILELFHDVTLKTSMGQTLDVQNSVDGRPNLNAFTMSRYNTIVKYKTSYYSFQLPVALALYLAGRYDPEMHRQAKTILLEMGHFFQVQDDFLDCFGNPEVTGKKGTDIREGKCTWLAVVALQRATPSQRRILEENYGREEPEAIQAVRNLYEELSLPNTYSIYEEESFNLIRTHIQQISKGLPHNLFFKFLDRFYKRDC